MKFCQNHWSLMSKLLKKPSALKRKHTALQNMKILYFFLYLWVIFALLDPDPATQMNTDPDPQPPVAMHWCSLDEGLRAAQGSPAQPAGAGGGEGAGEDGGRPPADEEVHRGNERDQSAAGAGRYRKSLQSIMQWSCKIPVLRVRIDFNSVPDTDPHWFQCGSGSRSGSSIFVNADPDTILDPH